jgi:hypothetical protein
VWLASSPRIASIGSPGSPCFQRTTWRGPAPRKLKRALRSPPSTDSRRNAWRSPREIFRNAETGVSVSASTSMRTGTARPGLQSFRNARRSGWRFSSGEPK